MRAPNFDKSNKSKVSDSEDEDYGQRTSKSAFKRGFTQVSELDCDLSNEITGSMLSKLLTKDDKANQNSTKSLMKK